MVTSQYATIIAGAFGILCIAFLLKDERNSFYFQIPTVQTSSLHALVHNITLLGTNDLHSSLDGVGLQTYQNHIQGGYSKLFYLINKIR